MDDDARGQIFWDLEGDDADDFVLTSTGMPLSTGFGGPNEPIMLRFKDSPDFENPTDSNNDSVYEVTLIADDRRGGTDSRSITIFVDNVAEKGGATMSPDQPLTGNDVTAAVEDPDNSVAIVTWQWQRATSTDPAADTTSSGKLSPARPPLPTRRLRRRTTRLKGSRATTATTCEPSQLIPMSRAT